MRNMKTVGGSGYVAVPDAAPYKKELTVYGKTLHNLWVNPPAATKNGITYAVDDDGSISFTGESTGETTISQATSYAFEPGKTYTASVDRSVADGNQLYFAVRNYYNGTGSHVASFGNGTNGLTKTFTIPANSDYVVLTIYSAAAGAIATGYFRVMINFGSTADPWCQPGIHGVDSLIISQHGKNLLDFRDPIETNVYSMAQVPLAKSKYTVGESYAIRVWGELGGDRTSIFAYNTGGVIQLANMVGGEGGTYADVFTWKNRGSTGYTNDEKIHFFQPPSSGTSTTRIDRMQLERGNSAIDYEPPRIRETAIDLQGYTLDSSPDGTRDELRIDASGKVTLIKRTHRQKFDGTENFVQYTGNADNYFTIDNSLLEFSQGTNGSERFFSDSVRCLYGGQRAYNSALIGVSFTTTNNPEYIYINVPGATDLTTAKAWLADNPLTIVYKTLEERVIDLGYVDWSYSRKGYNEVSAYSAVWPDIEMSYYRASNCGDGISADGVHSFYDLGQCIASRNTGTPEKKSITKTVPFMSGFYDFSNLYGGIAYESREATYSFALLGDSREDLQAQKSDMMQWLSQIHDAKIYDDDIPGFHFVGSYSSSSWEEGEEGESGTLEVTFLCQPFLEADEFTEESLVIGDNTVVNDGQPVNPDVVVDSGTATLTIGGITQQVTGTARLIAQLPHGETSVTVSGAAAKLRWRETKI